MVKYIIFDAYGLEFQKCNVALINCVKLYEEIKWKSGFLTKDPDFVELNFRVVSRLDYSNLIQKIFLEPVDWLTISNIN